jgi:hypothetical protein
MGKLQEAGCRMREMANRAADCRFWKVAPTIQDAGGSDYVRLVARLTAYFASVAPILPKARGGIWKKQRIAAFSRLSPRIKKIRGLRRLGRPHSVAESQLKGVAPCSNLSLCSIH